MAVAAYASLLSLTHVLDNLHYRSPFHLPLLDVNLVQTLQENVQFLLESVELHHLQIETPEIVDLWRHLAEVAFEAQQMVDSHVVSLLYWRSQGQTSVVDISDFCDDLESMISKLKKQLPRIHEACDKPAALVPAVAPPPDTSSSGKSVVVGFDDHVTRITDQLTVNKGRLQILSIVGMGGIGKTTLARCVYDDPHIVKYFDIRIWVTISQQFSVQQILMNLLATGRNDSTNVLGERLHKELFERRYLVIMDDMWSTKPWDEIRKYFPDNKNGSRILVTTRDTSVATCLGSLVQYPLSFLDGDTSWDLFCQIVFAQRGFPHAELEEIGRTIAKSCRGLPLEISVIGRLLANSRITQECWEDVGKNISSFGNLEDNEHCLKVLSLSYQSLPIHLKPCFLYLREFPEDANIYSETLIKHWVVEGFIKPARDKTLEEIAEARDETLEEIAEQYALDLINRSLMFMKGNKSYGVHDLLRDLCVRESIKENFIQSPKVFDKRGLGATECCLLCGISMGKDDVTNIYENSVHFPPSSQDDSYAGVACHACQRKYSHITKMRLVTAMTMQRGSYVPKALEFSTELRYLCFQIEDDHFVLHQTIHLLWNLEILDISMHRSQIICLPSDIWEMPKLRSVKAEPFASLANPIATGTEGDHFIILKNLQALSCIRNFKCTKEVVDRIPNLRYLNIEYTNSMDKSMMQPHYPHCNIAQLQKLECLEVVNAWKNITFPNSLKKLYLVNCQIAWENMSIIGSLPLLEVLDLYLGMEGSEWNPEEGEFVRLKDLEIGDNGLKRWRADPIHFRSLERLVLWGLESLEGIPTGIGDISTLRYIRVSQCSESAQKCAEQIREEQEELGNETLRVVVQ